MSLTNFPNLTDLESRLLVSFVQFADKNGFTRVDTANIHTNTTEFEIRPLMLKPTFEKLCDKDVLRLSRDNGSSYYELSSSYADAIDKYMNFVLGEIQTSPQPPISAADRFVEVDQNSKEFAATTQSLSKLAQAIRDANELTANSEDRIIFSKDVDHLRELISQPRVHLATISDFITSSKLKWLMEQTVSGLVRAAANDAFQHLMSFLRAYF
jgi:hypothetical protein